MTDETIAFAHPENPKKIVAWCNIRREDADGTIHFFCINGAWAGSYRDGLLRIPDQQGYRFSGYLRAVLAWRGDVPDDLLWSTDRVKCRDYNFVIPWIEEQIA
jgi:hypothetical protein